MKFQLAVFSYFNLLNFIALSVEIIVLHFNFIVDKREKNLLRQYHSYLCINHEKVFQGHAALFQSEKKKREKAQIPDTIEMKFRHPVYVPLYLV